MRSSEVAGQDVRYEMWGTDIGGKEFESMDKGYEKIEVLKLSRELAVRVHEMTMSLPKFEMYEEGSQSRVET